MGYSLKNNLKARKFSYPRVSYYTHLFILLTFTPPCATSVGQKSVGL